MLPRFFVPGRHTSESVIELSDEESAHLKRVLRLSVGDAIRVFDGAGREWDATVREAGRQRAAVSLDREVTPLPEPRVAITLAVAVLKAEKMDDVVRDAAMLGVAAIQPLITQRTEITAAVIARSGRIARWQRIAVSAAKQCGRAVVPTVHHPNRFAEVLQRQSSMPIVMMTEPQAGSALALCDVPHDDSLLLVIGPEGGWTPQEVQQARDAGAMLVTLGGLILRADATPLVALTALRVALRDI